MTGPIPSFLKRLGSSLYIAEAKTGEREGCWVEERQVTWVEGEKYISLHGDFSAEELRAMADLMDGRQSDEPGQTIPLIADEIEFLK
jgi:hypothetical protein